MNTDSITNLNQRSNDRWLPKRTVMAVVHAQNVPMEMARKYKNVQINVKLFHNLKEKNEQLLNFLTTNKKSSINS